MPTVASPTTAQSLIRLNNGLSIPVIGLGVYLAQPGATTREAVLSALRLGYKHVDTAQFYKNEKDVGDAVRESGLVREDVWITSKVPGACHGVLRQAVASHEFF
jgi:diketogulonate reductase-like aldo/keto reductase